VTADTLFLAQEPALLFGLLLFSIPAACARPGKKRVSCSGSVTQGVVGVWVTAGLGLWSVCD